MKKLISIFSVFMLLCVSSTVAQILDDDDVSEPLKSNTILDEGDTAAQVLDNANNDEPSSVDRVLDETDANEALFNEIFSDYPETDRDVTKIKTFDDAMDKASEFIKVLEDVSNHPPADEELPPLDGDIEIGISRGSFNVYKNDIGRPECTFYVTLKSNLNRQIKTLGINLLYPFTRFAFIFRNVPPHGSQEQPMRTIGYSCYQMDEIPDLDVNSCKIRTASGKECIQRLKWVKNIEPPKVEEEKPITGFDDISFDGLQP